MWKYLFAGVFSLAAVAAYANSDQSNKDKGSTNDANPNVAANETKPAPQQPAKPSSGGCGCAKGKK